MSYPPPEGWESINHPSQPNNPYPPPHSSPYPPSPQPYSPGSGNGHGGDGYGNTYTTPEGFEHVGGFSPSLSPPHYQSQRPIGVASVSNPGPYMGGENTPGLAGAFEERKRVEEEGTRGMLGDVAGGVLGLNMHKKDKEKKKKDKKHSSSSSSDSDSDNEKKKKKHDKHSQPPPYAAHGQPPPPAGHRIPLTTQQAFPGAQQLGQPAAHDVGGQPVYLCSAITDSGVHPAKAAPHLRPPVRLAYGGRELEHNGRYDILPWDPDRMTWIRSSGGKPPQGWENKVVEGGYENGGKLWHARTEIGGVMVPGKTGVHLGGANFAFGGEEVVKREEYDVLCWR